ncbi:hypothetical protein HQ47_05380 [Porphyromonas macacae]|uniref:Calcineurin-like phosphoesterase domain-containing protein n=1 Tax=Porphyromonas macacae TaxID=28115 RepID=A0A0A2EDF3_9PORP|nr:metallophosphoesterase [Porphyromonas macacae]KGN74469.1 hypothetical protein HQ47_05380 [Porphyromonas macacae]
MKRFILTIAFFLLCIGAAFSQKGDENIRCRDVFSPEDSVVFTIWGNKKEQIELFYEARALPVRKHETQFFDDSLRVNYGVLPPGFYRIDLKENDTSEIITKHFRVMPHDFKKGKNILNIIAISDVHLMAHELGQRGSRAFEEYLRKDRKLLAESEDIAKALIDTLKQSRPDIVLVSGDLTKDGAAKSHERFAELFDELRALGTQIYVVPGNHDINNPYARRYAGDGYTEVETFSPDDFPKHYADYGYQKAWSRDTVSLSYAVSPNEKLCIIALDACKYRDNTLLSRGDKADRYHSDGYLKPETLKWLKNVSAKARAKGQLIIAMMHHGVIEHFPYQARIMKPYLVDNYAEVIQCLTDCGIKLIVTGHFHAVDVAKIRFNGKELYDMEVGALVTYPCAYRTISLNLSNGDLAYTTDLIRYTGERYYTSKGEDFQMYARKRIAGGLPSLLSSMIFSKREQLAGYLNSESDVLEKYSREDLRSFMLLFEKELGPLLADLILLHYEGNEQLHDTELLKNAIDKHVVRFLKSAAPDSFREDEETMLKMLESMGAYRRLSSILELFLKDLRHAEDMRVDDCNGRIKI